jgi:hypothetical protein
MSPRSWLDVTSDTTRASTTQKYPSGPSQLHQLDGTSQRTPRRSRREPCLLAACNGLHGRDLRRADDVSPDPTAYDLPSLSSKSTSFGRTARGSWAVLKHFSSELTLDPNSPRGADHTPRFHRPTSSPSKRQGRSSGGLRGDLIVHDLAADSAVGPGAYDVDRSMSASSPRIGHAPQRLVTRIEKSPGPTEYQSHEVWSKKPRSHQGRFTTLSDRSRAQIEKSSRAAGICRGRANVKFLVRIFH